MVSYPQDIVFVISWLLPASPLLCFLAVITRSDAKHLQELHHLRNDFPCLLCVIYIFRSVSVGCKSDVQLTIADAFT